MKSYASRVESVLTQAESGLTRGESTLTRAESTLTQGESALTRVELALKRALSKRKLRSVKVSLEMAFVCFLEMLESLGDLYKPQNEIVNTK